MPLAAPRFRFKKLPVPGPGPGARRTGLGSQPIVWKRLPPNRLRHGGHADGASSVRDHDDHAALRTRTSTGPLSAATPSPSPTSVGSPVPARPSLQDSEPASDSERRGRYRGGREANLNLDGPSIGRLGGSCQCHLQCQSERRCRCLITGTGHLVTQTPSLTVTRTGVESDGIRGEGHQDVVNAITSSGSYAPFRSCHRANKAV